MIYNIHAPQQTWQFEQGHLVTVLKQNKNIFSLNIVSIDVMYINKILTKRSIENYNIGTVI
jgi:hypothetical protein